jgi:hypothetical protein
MKCWSRFSVIVGLNVVTKGPHLREEVRPVKSEIAIYDFRNFDLCKVRKFMV